MTNDRASRRIQNIHGVQYVYEDFASWDKTKKNATHTRRYIGKMVDNVFVLNTRYLLEHELEAAKEKKLGAVPATLSRREFCGAIYLFDQIGEKLGMTADLQACFPEI